ncbi:MAG TPA: TetR/AcrR family transcriptional regulator [Kofleriaceae bacterium]|nr:TetR/AcrR family transcriptional regulator [Kofleriaceae bacterium]
MASSAERDSARRAEILEAAKSCFLRYGYGKTSLDDIAKQAGLSRPLLYRKFANKEAIFSAVYDAVFLAQFEKAVLITTGPGSAASRLVSMIEVVCVEPYAMILQAPMAEEFYAACEQVIPEILQDHRKKWRALLAKVLAKDLVEVFDLALDGLYADIPSAAVFRKRIAILVKRFTS